LSLVRPKFGRFKLKIYTETLLSAQQTYSVFKLRTLTLELSHKHKSSTSLVFTKPHSICSLQVITLRLSHLLKEEAYVLLITRQLISRRYSMMYSPTISNKDPLPKLTRKSTSNQLTRHSNYKAIECSQHSTSVLSGKVSCNQDLLKPILFQLMHSSHRNFMCTSMMY